MSSPRRLISARFMSGRVPLGVLVAGTKQDAAQPGAVSCRGPAGAARRSQTATAFVRGRLTWSSWPSAGVYDSDTVPVKVMTP
jgi:hypothetical protein